MSDEFKRPRFFHRWYDNDVQLGALVADMEGLEEESQTLFAYLITQFSDELVRVKGSEFFNELDWNKIRGLYKARQGRRWYDQEPALKRAFNLLYSLSDADQSIIARQLHIPCRLARAYELDRKTKALPIQIETVCEIVEAVFKEGPAAAQERYKQFD